MALVRPMIMVAGKLVQAQTTDTIQALVSEVDATAKTNDNAGAITLGQVVYPKANGNVDLARANSSGTVEVMGFVAAASIAAAAAGAIQMDGLISASTATWDALTGDTGGLTPGAVYYLSPTTPGSITKTAPTTSGQFVVRVGLADSTTTLRIQPHAPIGL